MERKGVNCCQCGQYLRGDSNYSFTHERYSWFQGGALVYCFFGGEYYRPAGGSHYCRRCFWAPKIRADQQQQEQEQQRQREQEAARRQQEELERRKREEERKKVEYNARLKVEMHRWLQSENEDYVENSIGEHFKQFRRQVNLGRYRKNDPAEMVDEAAQLLRKSNSQLDSSNNFLSKIHEYFITDAYDESDNEFEKILAVLHIKLFYEWPENNEKLFKVEWLKTLQTFLLELYLSRFVYNETLNKDDLDTAFDDLNSILVDLCTSIKSEYALLNFTKVLFVCAVVSEDDGYTEHSTFWNARKLFSGCLNATMPFSSNVRNLSNISLSKNISEIVIKLAVEFLEKLLSYSDVVPDTDTVSDSWRKACCQSLITYLSQHNAILFAHIAPKLSCLTRNDVWDPAEMLRLLRWISSRSASITESKAAKIEYILHMILTYRISSQHLCGDTKISLINYIESHKTFEVKEELLKIVYADNLKTLVNVIKEMETTGAIDLALGDKVKNIIENAQAIFAQQTTVMTKETESDAAQIRSMIETLRQLEMSEENLSTVLATLSSIVRYKHGYVPTIPQMVSWCVLALSARGCLQEISTGEGKSCIISMFAVFLCLKGKHVDVVTSSSVLAQRDVKDWEKFYELFGITVSHNIDKANDEDRRKCYTCDIVYGTVDAYCIPLNFGGCQNCLYPNTRSES